MANRSSNPTTADVLAAMASYDAAYPKNDYENWLDNANYTNAIQMPKHLYPPKIIWSLVEGNLTTDFNTTLALRELKALGFTIVRKPGAIK